MRSEAYLNEIRKADGLKRAVLKKLTLEGNVVTFHLLTDLSYSERDVAYAGEVSEKYVPQGCKAAVDVKKSVPSAESVRAAILQILKAKFPASTAFLTEEDIEVTTGGQGGSFFVSLTKDELSRLPAEDVLNGLSAQLMRSFCGNWIGSFRTRTREETPLPERAPPPEEFIVPVRTFGISDYVALDGAAPQIAVYCADLSGEMQNVTVCGTIVQIEEKLSKNEKPYFRIFVSDGSGQAGGLYFPRKAFLEKVRSLKMGDAVCLTGSMERYRESLSFRVNRVDYGSPPKGFVPKERPSRAVPALYRTVFPQPAEDLAQGDVFGGKELPADVKEGRFVVFDLETTGLNNNPAGGTMDRIIEFGAVGIENGKITQKFSSFVACPVKLSKEITDITGIEDDMLLGAPEIGDVIADFYKFCDGAVLVGHNVQFDCRFVRYYGEKEGYYFRQRQLDTLSFAQELLSLKNYKLNTVADHFGFTFRHHRAFDDAFVTAKIFLELARMKGGLPKF